MVATGDDMDFAGKTAVVIGASMGIGRAYALALAAEGASVVAAARSLGAADGSQNNTLHNTVKRAEGLAGTVVAQPCDVLDEAAIEQAIGRAISEFGRIDVLVNNAALMTTFDPFEIGREDWDRIMQVNLRAAYVAIRSAAPHMIAQGCGSVVNVTAKAGEFVPRGERLFDGTLLYALTKAGLNRLTFYMSEELAPHGIAVNALSPGVVATDTVLAANPNARDYGAKEPTPEVMGPALLYLAKQTSAGITGQILHTDNYGKSWP